MVLLLFLISCSGVGEWEGKIFSLHEGQEKELIYCWLDWESCENGMSCGILFCSWLLSIELKQSLT